MRALIILLSLGVAVVLGTMGYFAVGDFDHGGNRPLWTVPGGDPRQGRRAIVKYGCSACHVVAGVGKARGRVGPKLLDIHQQIYIGGVLPNSPANMIKWIRSPRQFSPETVMPNLDVSEQDARNIAAHLHTAP